VPMVLDEEGHVERILLEEEGYPVKTPFIAY
jgi:hypothetical protein